MLAALTTRGLQAPMTIAEPTDGDIFLAYLEQVLCPRLRPGQVVIMDNLAAHRVAGVREQIEVRGAKLIYLPKVKQILRSLKARSADALESAVAEALKAITPENAMAWFSDCGYRLHYGLCRSSEDLQGGESKPGFAASSSEVLLSSWSVKSDS